MDKRLVFSFYLLSFFVSGCDSSNSEKSEYCSKSYVESYNAIHDNIMGFETSYKQSDLDSKVKYSKLEAINSSCENFYVSHGYKTCKAFGGGAVKEIGSVDFKKQCDYIRNLVDVVNRENNVEKIGFLVVDPKGLSSLVNSSQKTGDFKMLMGGWLVSNSSQQSLMKNGETFCVLNSTNKSSWMLQNVEGRLWKVVSVDRQSVSETNWVHFHLDDQTLTLSCGRVGQTGIGESKIRAAVDPFLRVQPAN